MKTFFKGDRVNGFESITPKDNSPEKLLEAAKASYSQARQCNLDKRWGAFAGHLYKANVYAAMAAVVAFGEQIEPGGTLGTALERISTKEGIYPPWKAAKLGRFQQLYDSAKAGNPRALTSREASNFVMQTLSNIHAFKKAIQRASD